MKAFSDSKRGSVLVGTVLMVLLAAGVVGGYMTMSLTEYKLAQRTLLLQSCINLAEAGLEEGMDSINTQNWTGWTPVGSDGYFSQITGITFADGRKAQIRVYVEDYDSLPILAAEGRHFEADGKEVLKQIRVDLKKRGAFANGLTAKDTISFSGNNVSVDAYDSASPNNGGKWNATLNRLDQGSVASTSVNNGALSIGNGDVWGYVATGGGLPDVGPSGSVKGEDSPGGGPIDPNRVSDDFYANLWDVSAPADGEEVEGITYNYLGTSLPSLTIGDLGKMENGEVTKPEVYHLSSLTLSATEQLNIIGPTVLIVDGDISVSGLAGINIWDANSPTFVNSNPGSLEIYAAGDVKIAGNGFMNETQEPLAFQLWGTASATSSGQTIYVAGNGDTAGVFYAPNAHLTLNGNGNISGAAVGKTIDLTGNAAFHYDIRLADFEKNATFSIDRWRELRGVDERLDFSDPSSIADAIEPL